MLLQDLLQVGPLDELELVVDAVALGEGFGGDAEVGEVTKGHGSLSAFVCRCLMSK